MEDWFAGETKPDQRRLWYKGIYETARVQVGGGGAAHPAAACRRPRWLLAAKTICRGCCSLPQDVAKVRSLMQLALKKRAA